MNMPPLSTSVPLMAPPQAKPDAEATPKPATLDPTKTDAPAGAATSVPSDKPKDGDFAALLAAARPKTGAANTPGKAQGAAANTPGDAALATLIEQTNTLVASFEAETEAPDLTEMVTAFIAALQGFDAATGGNAMAVLAENLGQLDATGLAGLEAAALNPATLFATLAALAGLPVADKGGIVVQTSLPQQKLWSKGDSTPVAPLTPAKPQIAEEMAPPQPAALSPDMPAVTKTLQQQPGTPVELRNLVMAALATAGAGAGPEAEGVALSSTQADLRPIMTAAPDMARPAQVWQPPVSGFARNLAQQIRTATFVDGHTRISLAPRGLGEIEIDMRPDEAGKLRIILRAENPAVLHALRGDRDGLLMTLTDSGADVRDADLSFEDFGQRHRREAGSADAPSGRLADVGPADAPDPVERPRHLGATGTLDMLT